MIRLRAAGIGPPLKPLAALLSRRFDGLCFVVVLSDR
ncbi:hypothetical protein GGE07_000392 [Sinorhizobium terangae]|nr:hypothetical protein [Sinorhizobium terangae]